MEPTARYQASVGWTPSSSCWSVLGLQPSLPTGAGHRPGRGAAALSPLAPTSQPPLWPLGGVWLGREAGHMDRGGPIHCAPQDLQICPRTLSMKKRQASVEIILEKTMSNKWDFPADPVLTMKPTAIILSDRVLFEGADLSLVISVQGRQGSRSCIPDSPEVRPRLEGKQSTLLSSQVVPGSSPS